MSGRSSEGLSRRKGKGSRRDDDSTWLGFVSIDLSDTDRASLAQLHFEAEDAFSFLEEMCDDGYKVTVSEDGAHSCYICSATGRTPDNQNRGYTLSGRGKTFLGSVASLAYKHITLCERGAWTNYGGSSASPDYS